MSVSSNSLFLGSGLYFFYIHLLQLSLSLASVLPKLGFFYFAVQMRSVRRQSGGFKFYGCKLSPSL